MAKRTKIPLSMASEARASCSLDGETQYCIVCERKMHEHTCGRRPMTEAESATVEAALDWYGNAHESSDKLRCQLQRACSRVRKERAR